MRNLVVFAGLIPALALLAFSVDAQQSPGTAAPANRPAAGSQQNAALVAKGKERFQAYKCYDCHGQNGEGTQDAPDLTHSKLTAEQVSKFLQKPRSEERRVGKE